MINLDRWLRWIRKLDRQLEIKEIIDRGSSGKIIVRCYYFRICPECHVTNVMF